MRLLRRPTVTGGDVEGAVYTAIFLDFAALVGLDLAASSYFAANALTIGQYREFIAANHPEHLAALDTVRDFWGCGTPPREPSQKVPREMPRDR
jgi:hypothetical protein